MSTQQLNHTRGLSRPPISVILDSTTITSPIMLIKERYGCIPLDQSKRKDLVTCESVYLGINNKYEITLISDQERYYTSNSISIHYRCLNHYFLFRI